MESTFALMQMAKISSRLALLKDESIPYIAILTDPTTGGATASFAMLGDINIAEPKAIIGYTSQKIVRETVEKDLPKDFQTSEYLLEHGFIDMIVERKDLRNKVATLLGLLMKNNVGKAMT